MWRRWWLCWLLVGVRARTQHFYRVAAWPSSMALYVLLCCKSDPSVSGWSFKTADLDVAAPFDLIAAARCTRMLWLLSNQPQMSLSHAGVMSDASASASPPSCGTGKHVVSSTCVCCLGDGRRCFWCGRVRRDGWLAQCSVRRVDDARLVVLFALCPAQDV